ncbi:hypothetical protein ABZ038_12630 [Streptomyces sp. NPDC006349]|uniref:hypothetical protein n=1 Tax=Streptomyces sp. NPDC006349 TaxID=3156757 RepID=UPI0006CDC669|nr:hypothetical protein ADL35_32945 [Streptomyces sp. NRRL WC-3753]
MDVTAALLRAAAVRPRVLLVPTPGGTPVRLAVEKELRLRDWPAATSPAGADLLLVAGPVPEQVRSMLDRLWQDVPQPRVRVQVSTVNEVAPALNVCRTRLGALDHSASDSDGTEERPGGGSVVGGHGGEQQSHDVGQKVQDRGDAGPHDAHGCPDHDPEHPNDGDGQDHAGHGGGVGGHGSHGGHEHGDMEMPGGLPMAEPGEDRDGLTLDCLHIPLGPFLIDWPAGLIVRVVLQGDVIQQAHIDAPSAEASIEVFWARPWIRAAGGETVRIGEAARWRAAAHLDSLGRLLSVVGWPAEAVTARRLRDDFLGQAPVSVLVPRAKRLARRVGRSRTLYWLTRGIGPVSSADARAAGVSGPAARAGGDVTARYRQWLTELVGDAERMDDDTPLNAATQESPRGRWGAERAPSAALTDLLPRLLEGTELAAARLIVASLDPDPDELAVDDRVVARG